MKNEFNLYVLLLNFVKCGIACIFKDEQSNTAIIDKEQIKKIIQAKEDEFAIIYNSRQLIKIRYYADDAISYSQNSRPLIDKFAIVKFLEEGINFS